jgi:hypothetical protein
MGMGAAFSICFSMPGIGNRSTGGIPLTGVATGIVLTFGGGVIFTVCCGCGRLRLVTSDGSVADRGRAGWID